MERVEGGTASMAAELAVAPIPWRGIVAVIVCASVFDVMLGLSYPLLALVLEARGYDSAAIGLNSAATAIGIIVFAPLMPAFGRWLGVWRLAVTCIVVTGLAFFALKLFESFAVWLLLRFLLGAAIGALFTVSEAWINEFAGAQARGRVIAIYSSLLSLGFAAGPFLLMVTGSQDWLPFIAGGGFALVALVPLLLVRGGMPNPQPGAHVSFVGFLPLAPVLLFAVGMFALFDTGTMSLFPLYGLSKGLSESTTSLALGVLIGGNVVLQFFFGWLADRFPKRAVMIGCGIATAIGGLLLPLALDSLWLWPLLFVWGATAFGIYTVSLAELGDRFSGAALLAGSAAFAAVWGMGGIVGPPMLGGIMERFGPDGFPLAMAFVFGLFSLVVLLRRRPRGG